MPSGHSAQWVSTVTNNTVLYKQHLNEHVLTHLPLDKMAAILADDIFKCIFLNENYIIPIQISLKCVPRSPIDIKPVLVQVMAWRQIGDKPLPEPMMVQFIDAYMRHYGDMRLHQGYWMTYTSYHWKCDLGAFAVP